MKFQALEKQPDSWEFHGTDDIFIKQMFLPKSGMVVPQHAHAFDHYTLLASGSMQVWADGVKHGDYVAPSSIFIKAGIKHLLISRQDNTVAYCIHNLHGKDAVEVVETHELEV